MENRDHDLLIELKTEIKAIRQDIKELKDNTVSRLGDHERRIRNLERWGWGAIGALTVLEVITRFIK